ncbi:hypothetical protein MIDIC_490032 [Alphaproteobacteria bacterium]
MSVCRVIYLSPTNGNGVSEDSLSCHMPKIPHPNAFNEQNKEINHKKNENSAEGLHH